MPIIDLQQRARELGRIRIGQVQPTKNGKTRPAKLDKFRLTSASKPLLEKVAALYGGEVGEWTPANGGLQAWEVFTDATRLPILVPPQPVTQWYELWSGGGCQRRCDGQREIKSDRPCICAQADERICKPTTRLNVVLRDVEGIGVFRLESHGYYAAVELPNVAAFLAQAPEYVEATLVLEERVVKREGEQTRRFMVPAIEIEGITPGELVSGGGRAAVAAPQERAAIEAPTEQPGGSDQVSREVALVAACRTPDELTATLRKAIQGYGVRDITGLPEPLQAAFAKAKELLTVADKAGLASAPAGPPPDAEALWAQIVAAWPGDRTDEIEDKFAEIHHGEHPSTAAPELLAQFLEGVKAGHIKPAADTGLPF